MVCDSKPLCLIGIRINYFNYFLYAVATCASVLKQNFTTKVINY